MSDKSKPEEVVFMLLTVVDGLKELSAAGVLAVLVFVEFVLLALVFELVVSFVSSAELFVVFKLWYFSLAFHLTYLNQSRNKKLSPNKMVVDY